MNYEVRRIYLHNNGRDIKSQSLGEPLNTDPDYTFDGYGVYRRDPVGQELLWYRDTSTLSDAVNLASIANAQ